MTCDQVHMDVTTRERWYDHLGMVHPRRNIMALARVLGLEFSHTVPSPDSPHWKHGVAVMNIIDTTTYAYLRLKHNM